MADAKDIVITGLGVVSPIGTGNDAFWSSLIEGRSGVRRLLRFDNGCPDGPFGGEIVDFDPVPFVRPRKSLKVMCRDVQLGFAAAELACDDAGLPEQPTDPDRLGVVFGAELMPCEPPEMTAAYRACLAEGRFDFGRWGDRAMSELYPLWMLKYLPNMPACHIGIARDARGPNNSLTLGAVSSLSSIAESIRVIQRGQADVVIAGGASSRIHPTIYVRSAALQMSRRARDPARASRPFDARRDGLVNGEGAGALILETRAHAEARGARIRARVASFAEAFEPRARGRPLEGRAVARVIETALGKAGLRPADLDHVNAHGMSTAEDDRIEAQAIRRVLGDVPVTAPKSFFGYLGAGTGAVEMAASLLAFERGRVPATLNYQRPDPDCPVRVIAGAPATLGAPTALVLNHAQLGQAAAVVVVAE